LLADGKPDRLRVQVRSQDKAVEFHPARLHQRFDLLYGDRRHLVGVLEVVFHVPAQVALLLVAEAEGNGRLALQVGLVGAAQGQAHAVPALPGGGLADVQDGLRHEALPFRGGDWVIGHDEQARRA
jgi:hypothetical protein